MISIYKILKEVITPTQEYQELVNDIVDQGGEYLGEGDYGAVFLVGNKVKKVTTDSEELEDAQQIKGQKTKYFVYIYDVEVRNPKLGIITMDNLEPFTGSEKESMQKIAICGGSGFFLLQDAIAQQADVYITSDIKYHEFFDAEGRLMLMDIGHFESEQFTSELIMEKLSNQFPNIAVLLSKTVTNPVFYA
jgi:putative NIF3 family GTP cyclohydrolase 1 type 2